MGTFVIKQAKTGPTFALKAGNGEIIAKSEVYSSKEACLKGIESVRKNAAVAPIEDQTTPEFEKMKNPKFELYTDKVGEFRFRLKARNGEIIAASEGYVKKESAINGINSVTKNAPNAQLVEE